MAADLGALGLAMEAILDTSPWQDDVDVVEIPWREEKLQSIRNRSSRRGERDGKLVFAVMGCDRDVQPHPPVRRAMKLVTEALLQQGYEVCQLSRIEGSCCAEYEQVVEWSPPSHRGAVQTLVCHRLVP